MVKMTDTILTETDSSLDRDWRNMEFCYAVMEQNREMERFVNECLIKASGNKKAINEMYIQEATAASDKIKAFFDKIKNFFKKIFDKLGASLNGIFMEQKKYMDKYANIITKYKWKAGDVSDIYDRFKGLPRILDAVENSETAIIGNNMNKFFKDDYEGNNIKLDTYKSANDISKAYADPKNKTKLDNGATRDEAFNEFISEGYWHNLTDFASFKETDSNNNINTNKTFLDWFNGSKDTVSYSNDEVENNFQTIINVTYAGQSYINKLDRIVSSVTKKMDEASRVMEDYHKAQQDKIMQAIKGTSTIDQNAEEKNEQHQPEGNDPPKPEGNKQPITPQQNSYIAFYKNYNSFVNEEPTIQNGSTTSNSGSGSNGNASVKAGTGAKDIENASNANTNIGKMQTAKMDAKGMEAHEGSNETVQKQAQELLDVDIYNREIKINECVNISSTIVRKLFDAFKATNADFFSLIKAHVQWYLSNPGEDQKDENKSSNSKSLNMNAGSEKVQKTNPNPGDVK